MSQAATPVRRRAIRRSETEAVGTPLLAGSNDLSHRTNDDCVVFEHDAAPYRCEDRPAAQSRKPSPNVSPRVVGLPVDTSRSISRSTSVRSASLPTAIDPFLSAIPKARAGDLTHQSHEIADLNSAPQAFRQEQGHGDSDARHCALRRPEVDWRRLLGCQILGIADVIVATHEIDVP